MIAGVRIPSLVHLPLLPAKPEVACGDLERGVVPVYCGSLFSVSVEPPLSERNSTTVFSANARRSRAARILPTPSSMCEIHAAYCFTPGSVSFA